MAERRIVSIEFVAGDMDVVLYAVADDGSVWFIATDDLKKPKSQQRWRRLELPELPSKKWGSL